MYGVRAKIPLVPSLCSAPDLYLKYPSLNARLYTLFLPPAEDYCTPRILLVSSRRNHLFSRTPSDLDLGLNDEALDQLCIL